MVQPSSCTCRSLFSPPPPPTHTHTPHPRPPITVTYPAFGPVSVSTFLDWRRTSLPLIVLTRVTLCGWRVVKIREPTSPFSSPFTSTLISVIRRTTHVVTVLTTSIINKKLRKKGQFLYFSYFIWSEIFFSCCTVCLEVSKGRSSNTHLSEHL